MKKFFLLLFIVSGITGYPQNGDTTNGKFGKRKLIPDAATVEKLQKIKDSVINIIPVIDKDKIQEDISHNIDGILQLQKEQKAKQKKAAMIRIGIGVALLALLIIGLRRRKK
jgi:hypothetical protein